MLIWKEGWKQTGYAPLVRNIGPAIRHSSHYWCKHAAAVQISEYFKWLKFHRTGPNWLLLTQKCSWQCCTPHRFKFFMLTPWVLWALQEEFCENAFLDVQKFDYLIGWTLEMMCSQSLSWNQFNSSVTQTLMAQRWLQRPIANLAL